MQSTILYMISGSTFGPSSKTAVRFPTPTAQPSSRCAVTTAGQYQDASIGPLHRIEVRVKPSNNGGVL